MKIAFIGDSFCANYGPDSWTTIVAQRLGAEIACLGKAGGCILDAWRLLQATINSVDYVCCCHTDAFRLPNRLYWPINLVNAEYYTSNRKEAISRSKDYDDPEVWTAALGYYAHICDSEFHVISHRLIIKDMDELLCTRGIRTVHMYNFETVDIELKSGPCLNEPLMSWLRRCNKFDLHYDDQDINHMNVSMNMHVADVIYHQLTGTGSNGFRLEHIPYYQ